MQPLANSPDSAAAGGIITQAVKPERCTVKVSQLLSASVLLRFRVRRAGLLVRHHLKDLRPEAPVLRKRQVTASSRA